MAAVLTAAVLSAAALSALLWRQRAALRNSETTRLVRRVTALSLRRKARLARRLFADRRVPLRARAVLPAVLLYLAMPLDIVPDFIPVVGYLDDVLVILASGVALPAPRPRGRPRGAGGGPRNGSRAMSPTTITGAERPPVAGAAMGPIGFLPVAGRLYGRLHLVSEAAGADAHPPRLAVHVDDALVDVGPEDAIGARRLALPAPRVPVPDVATVHRPSAADVALSSHPHLPFTVI